MLRLLDFELASDAGRVRLDITSPSSEGAQVARLLAGLDLDPGLTCA